MNTWKFILAIFAGLVIAQVSPADAANDAFCKKAREATTLKTQIELWTNCLETEPLSQEQQAIAYNCRGVAYYFKGEDGPALANLDRSLSLNPNNAEPYNNRALVEIRQNKLDRAMADLNRAIELNPQWMLAFFNRGFLYFQKKDWRHAISDLEEAARLDPDYAATYSLLAAAHLNAGEVEPAITAFTEAIRLNPDSALDYNNRGTAFGRTGHWKEAIADFDRAIEINPNLGLSYSNKAYILATCPDDQIRDGQQAVELAEKGISLKLSIPEFESLAHTALAAAFAEIKDFDQAIAEQEIVIDILKRANSPTAKAEATLKLYKKGSPLRDAGDLAKTS